MLDASGTAVVSAWGLRITVFPLPKFMRGLRSAVGVESQVAWLDSGMTVGPYGVTIPRRSSSSTTALPQAAVCHAV